MYKLPELPYDYDALQPYISEEIMRLHHTKHHQTYVTKLNVALDQVPELKDVSLIQLLSNDTLIPDTIKTTVRNNGGGHYNHSLFWQCMAPHAGGEPLDGLKETIVNRWGDFGAFVEAFNEKAIGLFGSGWVWLMPDGEIVTTENQDTPMRFGKGEPVMGLDVWEHAYYLDYKNKRDDYIKNWWNVVNWRFIEQRLRELQQK